MQPPVALQLYTVRDRTERDFAGTVRQVALQGYKGVEFAGYGGLEADDMAELLRETGLQAAGTHVGLAFLENNLDRTIEYCLAIGSRFLMIPGLEESERKDVHALALRLNDLGQQCARHGVSLGYHNHEWEFAAEDGPCFLDRLLEATDPALVALELDIGWAAYAGVDPIEVLRRRAGRVPLIHVKDFAADGESRIVGEGDVRLSDVLPVARDSGAMWFIVENESTGVPSLPGAERSLAHLRALGV